jgi:Flp pilus assembly protein TadD
MLRRSIRVAVIVLALVFVAQPFQSVHGILMTPTEIVKMATFETGGSTAGKQEGNGFLRALGAPFRAIGRLFGHKKKDENKLERITKKDIEKFQTVPASQTVTTTNAPAAQPAQAASTEAQANEPVSQDTQSSADPLDHVDKGRAFLNEGKLNEAIAELSTALSLDPKQEAARALLGVAYDQKGLGDLARQTFEKGKPGPDSEAMHLNNLGFLAYTHGEYESAVKYLKRAAKIAPTDERIWNNLGLAQAELGHFDDAYKSFSQVAGEFNGRLNVAHCLENHGETDKAIKQVQKALKLEPTSHEALGRLATLYDRKGRFEEAARVRGWIAAQTTVADSNPKKP